MISALSFSHVWKVGKLGLVSGCLLGVMMGCSSQLQMTAMSENEPPSTPQMDKMAKAEPVVPEAEATGQAPIQMEPPLGIPPIDIPVEEPARPAIRPSAPAEIIAAPQIAVGEVAEPPDQGETLSGISPGDSTEEEPARPDVPPSTPADIFATPRAEVGEPAEPAPFGAPLDAEPEAPSSPALATDPSEISPQDSSKALGVPPVFFEPEQPALPSIREEAAALEEDTTQGEPEPIQESVSASRSPIEEQTLEKEEQVPKPQEPFQMAKAVPGDSETMERRMEDSLKVLQDVYFDYDRFTIRKDALPVLEENAQALISGLSDKHLVIEGHCDERGTESYNMVLGERRANAIKEVLVDLGVPSEKLQVVSFGKEKPFCTDQNEQCWQENRRGHFVFK